MVSRILGRLLCCRKRRGKEEKREKKENRKEGRKKGRKERQKKEGKEKNLGSVNKRTIVSLRPLLVGYSIMYLANILSRDFF
jgi:hypothetical protein